MRKTLSELPKHGDTRIVNRFLFFPKTLHQSDSGSKSTRWLENCKILQRYIGYIGIVSGWKDIYWIDY